MGYMKLLVLSSQLFYKSKTILKVKNSLKNQTKKNQYAEWKNPIAKEHILLFYSSEVSIEGNLIYMHYTSSCIGPVGTENGGNRVAIVNGHRPLFFRIWILIF
jgi:hypothetical protein